AAIVQVQNVEVERANDLRDRRRKAKEKLPFLSELLEEGFPIGLRRRTRDLQAFEGDGRAEAAVKRPIHDRKAALGDHLFDVEIPGLRGSHDAEHVARHRAETTTTRRELA